MGFADLATLAEDDAFEAVVADDAGPESVVEIEDEALGGAAAGGGEEACEVFAVERGGAGVDLVLGAVPEGGVVPEGEAVVEDDVVKCKEVDGFVGGELRQAAIDFVEDGGGGGRHAVFVAAHDWG